MKKNEIYRGADINVIGNIIEHHPNVSISELDDITLVDLFDIFWMKNRKIICEKLLNEMTNKTLTTLMNVCIKSEDYEICAFIKKHERKNKKEIL